MAELDLGRVVGAGVPTGGNDGDVLVKDGAAEYAGEWTSTPPQMGSIATIATSPTTAAFAVGSYLVYNGQLYRVTATISSGQSLTPGGNIEAVSNGGINALYNSSYTKHYYSRHYIRGLGYATKTTEVIITIPLINPKGETPPSNKITIHSAGIANVSLKPTAVLDTTRTNNSCISFQLTDSSVTFQQDKTYFCAVDFSISE